MKQSKEVAIISEEVSPIVIKAEKLEIIDSPTMESAVEFLSKLNQENDRLVADRETLTKPLNETLKGIRAKYKPSCDILDKAIETIRRKMGDYQLDLINKRKEEEEKIAKKMESGKLSMDKALTKINNLEEVENKVQTTSGSIQFRTDYVVEITSKKLLPLEYLEPKDMLILKDLKAGVVVPGAKLVAKMVPVNKR